MLRFAEINEFYANGEAPPLRYRLHCQIAFAWQADNNIRAELAAMFEYREARSTRESQMCVVGKSDFPCLFTCADRLAFLYSTRLRFSQASSSDQVGATRMRHMTTVIWCYESCDQTECHRTIVLARLAAGEQTVLFV